MIIGRASDGTLLGINDLFAAEERLANAIADNIKPSVLPEIEIRTVKGKHLLVVQVAHWKGPFYLKQQGKPEGIYVRLGSTSRPISPEMLTELERSITYTSYDQEPISELSIDALQLSEVRRHFERIYKSIDRRRMLSLGLLAKFSNRIVPTVGGIILFGDEDNRMQFVPDARVSCARFRGTDKTHIIDRQEVQGTILDAVDQVMQFIARNTRLSAEIADTRRKDIPEYPVVALREALINALVHADYTIVGSHTRISIFSDRLEIINPGMLPFGYKMEDLEEGISRVRNRVIVRIFRELELMEEWGSGYRRIATDCEEKGYPIPQWTELTTSIRVVFYPHTGTILPTSGELHSLSPRQQAILDLLTHHRSLSLNRLAIELDEDISLRTLRHDLAQLRDHGLVTTAGKGRATKWQCVNKVT